MLATCTAKTDFSFATLYNRPLIQLPIAQASAPESFIAQSSQASHHASKDIPLYIPIQADTHCLCLVQTFITSELACSKRPENRYQRVTRCANVHPASNSNNAPAQTWPPYANHAETANSLAHRPASNVTNTNALHASPAASLPLCSAP